MTQYKRNEGMPSKPRPFAISIPDIEEQGKNIIEARSRSLFYLTYLTAGRISEILQVKREDITEETPGVICSILLRNQKNKLNPSKTLPLLLKGPSPAETYMAQFVWDWVKTQDSQFPLFGIFTRWDAWFLFTRLKIPTIKAQFDGALVDISDWSINPHYLRHCRLTHLATVYGLNSMELQAYAGWTSPKMANTYVHFDWHGLANALMVRKQQWANLADRLEQINLPELGGETNADD